MYKQFSKRWSKENYKDPFKVATKVNFSGPYSSTDDPEHTKQIHPKHIEHFNNYSKEIYYKYNSKGFRDNEWPEDVSDVIWCVGDSFTLGCGQPQNESWPAVLEKLTNKRCINLGQDGASNDTIDLRVQEIQKVYNPKLIVIMWSYLHRRRVNGIDQLYDKNDFGDEADIKNFLKNYNAVNLLPTKIIHLAIPLSTYNDTTDWDKESERTAYGNEVSEPIKKKISFLVKQNVTEVKQLDFSRDGRHFDIKTSLGVAHIINKRINDR